MSTITTADLDEAAIAVGGMDCASCVAHVEKAARGVAGVRECRVSLARGRAVVRFDRATTDPATIAAAITDSGYTAVPEAGGLAAGNVEQQRLEWQLAEVRQWRSRAIVGMLLWLPVELAHWVAEFGHLHRLHGPLSWVALVTSTIAIVYVGKGFFAGAWKGLRHGTSNMDTLIAMGASVAYFYSLAAFAGYLAGWWRAAPSLYFMESTGLLALISVGHWLEARARDAAGSAIRELLDLAPATAWRLDEGGEAPREVPVAALEVGDRVVVRPGDRVPVDGVVVDGRSDVDESMITGEPLPAARGKGDTVIGGTVNRAGRLIVRATKVGNETALAQIVKLVETAQSSKPPVQRLADRIAAVFVPSVLTVALLTGLGWYAWGRGHGSASAVTWAAVAKAVCSVLIIACPCALGLALPAALMVGTGRGAKRGILIRDVDALQHAERIDTVVLDKTGTVTRGRPVVVEVIASDAVAGDEVLRLAAAAEQYSEHPLARAIVERARAAASDGRPLPDLEGFENQAGLGVIATLGGEKILVGNDELLAQHGGGGSVAGTAQNGAGRSLVHVARLRDGKLTRLGAIAIADEVKSDSAGAVAELRAMGLAVVLLTGDNGAAAEAVARQVGIDPALVHAGVRPAGKAEVIRALQAQGKNVAMVGDGINDAPALARADLGIAIGSGSDVAKETGGIVLVSGSLCGVALAVRLSRLTMRKIRQNLFWAFAYNVVAIPLAALGLLNPLIAAAAMALSDVTVIGNALLLRTANLEASD